MFFVFLLDILIQRYITTLYWKKIVCVLLPYGKIPNLLSVLCQARRALRTLWQWRRSPTVPPSWPGVAAVTMAAPSPATSSRRGPPLPWAGRGSTPVSHNSLTPTSFYLGWCPSPCWWNAKGHMGQACKTAGGFLLSFKMAFFYHDLYTSAPLRVDYFNRL